MLVLPGGMKMLGEEGALPCWDSLVAPVLDHAGCADGSKAAVMCLSGFVGCGCKRWSSEDGAENCWHQNNASPNLGKDCTPAATCKGGRTSVCPKSAPSLSVGRMGCRQGDRMAFVAPALAGSQWSRCMWVPVLPCPACITKGHRGKGLECQRACPGPWGVLDPVTDAALSCMSH